MTCLPPHASIMRTQVPCQFTPACNQAALSNSHYRVAAPTVSVYAYVQPASSSATHRAAGSGRPQRRVVTTVLAPAFCPLLTPPRHNCIRPRCQAAFSVRFRPLCRFTTASSPLPPPSLTGRRAGPHSMSSRDPMCQFTPA